MVFFCLLLFRSVTVPLYIHYPIVILNRIKIKRGSSDTTHKNGFCFMNNRGKNVDRSKECSLCRNYTQMNVFIA